MTMTRCGRHWKDSHENATYPGKSRPWGVLLILMLPVSTIQERRNKTGYLTWYCEIILESELFNMNNWKRRNP
jgi:hypothetical protein